jgi:ATP-dependent RNA helicase DeaD
MKFADMSLHPTLQRQIEERGYLEATPVQEAVLAPELAGADLLVSSRTGSGKTIAFGLAFAPLLLENGTRPSPLPKVLVVAPTRELALQVARELSWLYASARVRVSSCVGGMDPRRERDMLGRGVDIVVGTPGRICDHIDRKSLRLDELKVVVLDEADEMLDMGFRDELERILEAAPKERRTLMFSATLPKAIEALAKRYTHKAHRITATSTEQAHQDIDYVAHLVAPRERELAVVNVLRFYDAPSALVFCARRDGVAHLHASLVERGFLAQGLSGELTQTERNRALAAMREGRSRVLVGTDVAARGLDLPAVGLVIHADLPHDGSVLQHRSGRTGRAGRKGTAVILAPFAQRRQAERMARDAKVALSWTPVPQAEQIRALDDQRFVTHVGTLVAEVQPDELPVARALLERHSPETLVAALVRVGRGAVPSPEELPQSSQGSAPTEHRPPRTRPGGDGVWFRVNLGRRHNADPRWLLPMLCRRGAVVKADIGRIEIGDAETRVEVNPAKAKDFEEAACRKDPKEPNVRIERAPLGGEGRPRRRGYSSRPR